MKKLLTEAPGSHVSTSLPQETLQVSFHRGSFMGSACLMGSDESEQTSRPSMLRKSARSGVILLHENAATFVGAWDAATAC